MSREPGFDHSCYSVGTSQLQLRARSLKCRENRLARGVLVGLCMMAKQLGWLGVLFVTGCLSRPLVEQAPETNNVFVDKIQQTAIDKIDLLFMIDNSASMSDKQEILKEAVPVLLSRLVSPICVDGLGKSTGVNALPNGKCPDNKGEPEFSPIGDIHIGIVSSSLGGHGGHQCAPANGASINPNDDKAHLVGSMRSSDLLGRTWDASGFLAWDSFGKANKPPGSADPGELNSAFRDMLGAVGESGCGYEASLESWYRFLVDPEPPALVGYSDEMTLRSSRLTVNPDGSPGACVGCDEALLAQRKAFLRPDSLVAIIMLTDENDCSIRDDSKGWWVSSTGPLKRGTSQCDRNPNDPCCRSCDPKAEANGPPAGCPSSSEDSACKEPNPNDSTNLRCYDQRRRFGFDLLYETSRYVDALTKTTLPLQSSPGTVVKNPLFDGGTEGKAPRDPSLVFLAGIVGVPWQDIADQASLGGPGLTYLTAKELKEQGRWQALLGDPSASPPQPPSDPFMVETLNERAGTNPFVGVSIAPAKSTDPHQNPINGHEQDLSKKQDDLQYACIFPLAPARDCSLLDPNYDNCDCYQGVYDRPICEQTPGQTPPGTTQYWGKAYPGSRELEVLKGFGEKTTNSIVASICARNVDRPADPDYGYRPAVAAIIERLQSQLPGR